MTQPDITPLAEGDLVFCDFDGTISVVDTGIAVIDALCLEQAWELEHIWRRGEISSMECLARQWDLVRLSPQELDTLLDGFALRDDFRDFVAFVRARGAAIVVVSDGLDYYVDRMLNRLGFVPCDGERVLQGRVPGRGGTDCQPVSADDEHSDRLAAGRTGTPGRPCDCLPRYANHAEVTEQGVRVYFPHRTPLCAQCGNCKLHHLFELRPHFRRVIYIGDGHSDMCPAKYADVLFARSHLAEDAAHNGMGFVPFESFADIMRVLR